MSRLILVAVAVLLGIPLGILTIALIVVLIREKIFYGRGVKVH